LCTDGELKSLFEQHEFASFMTLEVTDWEDLCVLKEAIGVQRRFQGSSTLRLKFGPASRSTRVFAIGGEHCDTSIYYPPLCLSMVSGIA